MQPPKDPNADSSDDEVAQQTKTFIGVNNPSVGQQAMKKEDLDYLQSGSTWDAINVNPELALRLTQLGFKRPSLIQFKVVKLSAQNSVVAQSQNGSGKTLAYLVPILNRAKELKAAPEGQIAAPQVLILADTKALILQVATLLRRICEGYAPHITVDYVFGGKYDIQPGTSILVSTLVQVKNLLQKKAFSPNNIDFLVVDEADSVFDADFNRAYFQTLISKLLKTDRFKAIFTSATMTDNFRKVIQSFQEKRNLILIELPVEKLTLTNVQQYQIECTNFGNKVETLFKLMDVVKAQNILIFDNKKKDLAELEKILTARGFKAAFIYKADERDGPVNAADYLQEKITDFLAGKYRILLTTNLLSRGIDMRKVTLVVNLSLPFKIRESGGHLEKKVDLETFLHRVGRTGRFGDYGIAVNFINNQEELGMMQEIQDHYKNKVEAIKGDNLKELDTKLQQIESLNREKRDRLGENI